MKHLKTTLLLIGFIGFSACDNDDTNTDLSLISGFYQVESMISKDSVDLNGDGEKSRDLKTEINDYFNDHDYDLEVRPNSTNDTEFKLISIYFPEPNLSFEFPSSPDGYVEFAKNSVGYQYEFNNNEFQLMPSENQFIEVDSFELADDGRIQSTLTKSYYDFEIQDWRMLEIEVVYVKLN